MMIPLKQSITSILLWIFTFGLLFFSCKSELSQKESPLISEGKLDLSEIDLSTNKPVALTGKWEFHWEQLLTSDDFKGDRTSSDVYYEVPAEWSEEKDDHQLGLSKFGYATYRSIIDLGKPYSDLALKIRSKGLAYKIIIDGKELANSGETGTNELNTTPQSINHVIPIKSTGRYLEIIIQSSNFHNRSGGLTGEVLLGDNEILQSERKRNIWTDLFLAGAILMMGIYHIGLFVARKNNYSPLMFAIFCFIIFVRILVSENFGAELTNASWVLIHKIDYLTYYLAFGMFFLYSSWVFRLDSSRWITIVAVGFSAFFAIGVIILPPKVYTGFLSIYHIFNLLAGLYLTYLMILAAVRKRNGAIIYLVGWLLFFASGINDLLYFSNYIETVSLIPFGLFLFILCQAFLLMIRYERTFKNNATLKNELNHINKNLETIVEERTDSLKTANDQLAVKNESITDSISYAKRIQSAILPQDDDIKKIIPDSFTILKPRNIVSGDFYWFTHLENTENGPVSVIVAADCTGHGVPGAFMSMSGSAFLNQVVNTQKIISPEKIAAAVNEIIKNTLHQDEESGSNRDGIDAAICTIYHNEKKIEFAGANRPLFYVQNNELKKAAGAKASMGGNQIEVENSVFEKHTISYAENDITAYLFSDGFTDQFGGPENKKFGYSQLKTLIKDNADKPCGFQESIFDMAIGEWIENSQEEQTDDILIMGFKLIG